MARGILICIVIAATSMVSIDTSVAQRGPLRVNQAFRFLGGGWSGGYHWRTPAPKVGYYNPYSHHNTQTRTGIVPQGAGSYMSRLGHYGGNQVVDVSNFDQIGTYHQSGAGYNFVPQNNSGIAPNRSRNVVNSEVDAEEDERPAVDYSKGPENDTPRGSILKKPESSGGDSTRDRQPSPSDQPEDDDEANMWKGFDELEALDSAPVAGGGR